MSSPSLARTRLRPLYVRRRLSRERSDPLDQSRLVPPGRLVVAGRRLTCGPIATLLRNFEGFAVSSTVIMLKVQAMKDLPRPVQWLIYYHECGHILYGPSEPPPIATR